MIAFIDEYRDHFSVEFICTTLNKQRQGGFITSRGYRNAKYGTPSARSIRDRELVAAIRQVHAANYGVVRMSFYEFIETTQASLVSFILTDGSSWVVSAIYDYVKNLLEILK